MAVRRQRLMRGAVFDNVGTTVIGWSSPPGPNNVKGGTRGERPGERSPRVSGSRCGWQADDSASFGRAIFNNLGTLPALGSSPDQSQDC
jgi:hypothetical protein